MKPILAALTGLAALALVAGGSAFAGEPRTSGDSLGADWRQQQDEVRELRRQRRLIPMGVVIQHIRRMNPGPRSQQLDAGLEYQGERPVYRVRWMTNDGRRIDYIVDAVTGQVISP